MAAVRTSAAAKQELREAAMAHVLDLGPAGPGTRNPGETSALITRGVDALDGYYARYLPQLVLAVIVAIVMLVAIMLRMSPKLTLLVAIVGPVIGIVIGAMSRAFRRYGGRIQNSMGDVTRIKIGRAHV